MDYTLVTVAHSLDMPLLKLQARSLNRYLDRQFVKQIIVVDNSTNGTKLDHKSLLPHYGDLSVRIVKAAEIAQLPKGIAGWFTQQVCKLTIAAVVPTKRYIILDAKNHAVQPLTRAVFEAPDGRIRTGGHGYEKHTLKRYLVRACEYLNVPQHAVMRHFLPTTPPFTMDTTKVRELIRYMANREKRSFVTSFLERGLTEFFLYGVFLVSKGHKLDNFYKFDTWHGLTLWKEDDDAKMQQTIARATKPFFAAHRASFKNMNAETRDRLAHMWTDRGLFGDYASALRFVEGCATSYA